MAGVGKKGPVFVPASAARLLDTLSKAALMDVAWNLGLLGTDESTEQVLANVAREACLVAEARKDRVSRVIFEAAKRRLDKDGDA